MRKMYKHKHDIIMCLKYVMHDQVKCINTQ